jgi:tRNA(fMet)-specific endonuclease VapC
MNRKPDSVIRRFKAMDVGMIGVSSITVSELYYGAAKSHHRDRNEKRLEEFLLPFDILPYDENAAMIYGNIRSRLEEKGNVIGPLDMLIAAHALSLERVLITNNEKEFRRVPSLVVENWIEG